MDSYLELLNRTFIMHRYDALKQPILKERILYFSSKLREFSKNKQINGSSLKVNEVRSIIKVFEELASNNERQEDVILKIIEILHFFAENKNSVDDNIDDDLQF